ncbi:UNVERIFIED_CONTAM: hypothetical protein Scaly_1779800 [Sesamum calycinum]|uniref:DUF4283 domain-containing protein n=1 Tax=Sesamum calycinum TaxID=2727403 RepID=A0AAW2NWC0_9LAMI
MDQTSSFTGGALNDGCLNTVASGIGKPLYPDAITVACTRLVLARVYIVLDISLMLPKRIIIMVSKDDGGEVPCKIDVEYEWVPPKYVCCSSLGHWTAACPTTNQLRNLRFLSMFNERLLLNVKDPPPKCSPILEGGEGCEPTERAVTQLSIESICATPFPIDGGKEEDFVALLKPVTHNEVKFAFFGIAEDKSPEPDGFSLGFYKSALSVVGEEIIRAILEFFNTGNCSSKLTLPYLLSFLRYDLLRLLLICGLFREGHLPARYLGLLLLVSRVTISDYKPLLLKIDSCIKGWEGIQLSFVGRIQLINSVLMALNVYWTMAFLLPKGVIREVVKQLQLFLWKGSNGGGYPKVAWQQPPLAISKIQSSYARDCHDSSSQRTNSRTIGIGNSNHTDQADPRCPISRSSTWNVPDRPLGVGFIAAKFMRSPTPRVNLSIRGHFIVILKPRSISVIVEWKTANPIGFWSPIPTKGHVETHSHHFSKCPYSRSCPQRIMQIIRFRWPNCNWKANVAWASIKLRGHHVVNAGNRALLASLAYHIFQERNRRRFQQVERHSSSLAHIVVLEVKQRIFSANLPHSVST